MTIVSANANAMLTGFIPKTYVGAKAAQNDTILFSNEAGVIPDKHSSYRNKYRSDSRYIHLCNHPV